MSPIFLYLTGMECYNGTRMGPLLKIMTENAEWIGLLQFGVFMFMLWDCLTDQVEDLTAHGVSVKLCKAFQFFMGF